MLHIQALEFYTSALTRGVVAHTTFRMNLGSPLKDLTIVAFDTETSGAYPLDSDLCEIAAVKWKQGQIIDTYQTLVKPRKPMSEFIIGIHGITNEMVEDAPAVTSIITDFHKFIQGSIVVAHHAPFDLGFVGYEFEKKNLMFPPLPALCSSLLSRKLFPESKNHKLQTLVDFFSLEKGVAHRALDDSKACLQVLIKCMEKFGWEHSLDELIKVQGVRLSWKDFSIYSLQDTSVGNAIVSAILNGKDIDLSYRNANDHRSLKPIGVVRNPDGDYVVAIQPPETQQKRFYFNRIVAAKAI